MVIQSAVQEPNPPLRDRAQEVLLRKKTYEYLRDLTDSMRETMKVLDGVGIAAPQVGESLRLFVIEKESFPERELPSDVFINPKIIRSSFKLLDGEEGCLSVKGVFGTVKRHASVTIEAFDLRGKKFRLTGKDLLARVLQHETDHLNGILFIDKAEPDSLHTYIREEHENS